MKISRALALLLLVGLFGSSCATVSRLNAEYEEETTQEMARVALMSPRARAEWQKSQRDREKIQLERIPKGR